MSAKKQKLWELVLDCSIDSSFIVEGKKPTKKECKALEKDLEAGLKKLVASLVGNLKEKDPGSNVVYADTWVYDLDADAFEEEEEE